MARWRSKLKFHRLFIGLLLSIAGCRAGGDLKNEDHYVALEKAEIAAENGTATTATTAPSPSPSSTTTSTAGPPYSISLSAASGASAGSAGSCLGPYTLSLADSSGLAASDASSTPYVITIQDSLGGAFYVSSTCATRVTSVTVAAGQSGGTSVYYKATTAGTSTASASNDDLVPAQLSVTITAGAPASITLSLSNPSSAAGSCGSVSYSLRDAYGNAATPDSAKTLTFLSSDPLGKVYGDSACATAAMTLTHSAGVSGRTDLYYLGKTAQAFTLTAGSSGLTSATTTGTTSAGSASWFVWSGSDATTAGTCLAVTLASADAYGNTSRVGSALAVSLTSSTGSAVYGDSLCAATTGTRSIAAGSSSVAVYFKGTLAASHSITATASAFSAASTSVAVSAGSATDLGISFALPLTAGACNAVTLSTQDAYGNRSTQSSLKTLTIAGGGAGVFYANSSCLTPSSTATVSGGTSYAATYYQSSVTLVSAITLSAASLNSASSAITLKGNTPVTLALTGTASPILQDCTAYTLTLNDTYGNASYNASGSSVLLWGGGSGGFYTASTCSGGSAATSASIPALSPSATIYYKNSAAQVVTLSAGNASISTGIRAISMTSGAPASLTLVGGDSTPIYAGYCSNSPYTLRLLDSFGNTAPATGATTVTFSSLSRAEPYLGWTCIGPVQTTLSLTVGQSEAVFYLSGTVPESVTFAIGSGNLAAASGTARFITRFKSSGGTYAQCFLLSSGRIKCVGYRANSQLQANGTATYIGNSPDEVGVNLAYVRLGTNRNVLHLGNARIGTGYSGFCAILDNHKIRCWGSANVAYGYENAQELGDTGDEIGDNLAYVNLGTNRLAYRISDGYAGFCVVTDTGGVKCYGFNQAVDYSYVQGYGDTITRGKSAGTMADNLPDVPLGTGFVAADVQCTYAHCCALANDGRAKCWGNGASGRTGYGDGLTRGGSPGQMGDCLPYLAVGTGRTVKKIQPLSASTCALLDNGRVRCFGDGSVGQILSGSTNDLGDQVGEIGDNLSNADLGTNRIAVDISAGFTTTSATGFFCALLDSSNLKCWGQGFQAGYGDNLTRGANATSVGDSLPHVDLGTNRTVRILTNSTASGACAILDNGVAKCWGYASGASGYGDSLARGNSPGQMGDCLPAIDFGEPASE